MLFWLRLVGLICLLLAAAKAPESPRVSWGWLGLALWALSVLGPRL